MSKILCHSVRRRGGKCVCNKKYFVSFRKPQNQDLVCMCQGPQSSYSPWSDWGSPSISWHLSRLWPDKLLPPRCCPWLRTAPWWPVTQCWPDPDTEPDTESVFLSACLPSLYYQYLLLKTFYSVSRLYHNCHALATTQTLECPALQPQSSTFEGWKKMKIKFESPCLIFTDPRLSHARILFQVSKETFLMLKSLLISECYNPGEIPAVVRKTADNGWLLMASFVPAPSVGVVSHIIWQMSPRSHLSQSMITPEQISNSLFFSQTRLATTPRVERPYKAFFPCLMDYNGPLSCRSYIYKMRISVE